MANQGIPVNLTSCQVALKDFNNDPHFKKWTIPAHESIVVEGGGYAACGFGVWNNGEFHQTLCHGVSLKY
jgi:hypothetical protein